MTTAVDPAQLASGVLAAEGQPFAILSLAPGFDPVTPDTPVAEARRCYMRLAAAIHPDRLQRGFDRATEAFQCLVRAFETVADPKTRKQAAAALRAAATAGAAAAGRKKAAGARRIADAAPPSALSSPAASQKSAAKAKAKTARPAQKRARRAAAEEADEEDDVSDSAASESEDDASAAAEKAWEAWAAADAEPPVSTNRSPIGQPRVGGLYQQTTVGCPKCRSLWEPDAKPQYSLFMGQWGKKVHCQLCLLHFGCATALHGCPHCSAPFDYDASMYDTLQTCQRCKKEFGFPYYPVSQHLIDQIALDEWRERVDRKKASEREARARARRGGADKASAAEEKLQLLVGSCVVEEMCPLCRKRVKSKHRAHVVECMAKSPAERQADAAPVAKAKKAEAVAKPPKAAPKSAVAKRSPAAPPKPRAKAATSAKKASAAPAKRKRRRDDSDSEEASMSESEEEDDLSSESSFSDEDDDDSD